MLNSTYLTLQQYFYELKNCAFYTSEWNYYHLQKWIENGCNEKIALRCVKLDCSYNNNKIGIRYNKLIYPFGVEYSWDKLTSLPPEIGKLSNLEKLNCHNNQIKTLPPEIGKLSNLEKLNCHNNQIKTLPPEIGKLYKLKEFDCSFNILEILPPEIGQLKNLEILNCSWNKLKTLPSEIEKLINLKKFDYSFNLFVKYKN